MEKLGTFAEGTTQEMIYLYNCNSCYNSHLISVAICFMSVVFSQLDKDDMVYMEAYDKLLESWLTLVQDDKHFHKGFFTQHAVQVFNSYIQCHLAAPDGTRNLVSFKLDRRYKCISSQLCFTFYPITYCVTLEI